MKNTEAIDREQGGVASSPVASSPLTIESHRILRTARISTAPSARHLFVYHDVQGFLVAHRLHLVQLKENLQGGMNMPKNAPELHE
jgi:hypothetical protein